MVTELNKRVLAEVAKRERELEEAGISLVESARAQLHGRIDGTMGKIDEMLLKAARTGQSEITILSGVASFSGLPDADYRHSSIDVQRVITYSYSSKGIDGKWYKARKDRGIEVIRDLKLAELWTYLEQNGFRPEFCFCGFPSGRIDIIVRLVLEYRGSGMSWLTGTRYL